MECGLRPACQTASEVRALRSVSKLAYSAVLASAAGTRSLQSLILPKCQVEEKGCIPLDRWKIILGLLTIQLTLIGPVRKSGISLFPSAFFIGFRSTHQSLPSSQTSSSLCSIQRRLAHVLPFRHLVCVLATKNVGACELQLGSEL